MSYQLGIVSRPAPKIFLKFLLLRLLKCCYDDHEFMIETLYLSFPKGCKPKIFVAGDGGFKLSIALLFLLVAHLNFKFTYTVPIWDQTCPSLLSDVCLGAAHYANVLLQLIQQRLCPSHTSLDSANQCQTVEKKAWTK